jgi:hypothetical protein
MFCKYDNQFDLQLFYPITPIMILAMENVYDWINTVSSLDYLAYPKLWQQLPNFNMVNTSRRGIIYKAISVSIWWSVYTIHSCSTYGL